MQNNTSVVRLNNQEVSFPYAAKASERQRITTTTKWKDHAKALKAAGVKLEEKAVLKVEQDKFMAMKRQAQATARMLGRELVSHDAFTDLVVDVWTDGKDRRNFSVRGKENPDAIVRPLTLAEQVAGMTPEALAELKKLIDSQPAPAPGATKPAINV